MSEVYTEEKHRRSIKENSRLPFFNRFRVERYLTRPLASLVVRLVFNTRVTPNQLTVFAAVLGVSSGLSYLGGTPAFFILGGTLLQLSSVFDCADGQLARAKGRQSRFGAYLDLLLDRVVDFFAFTGMVIGFFRYSGSLPFLIAGLVSAALYFLQVSLYYIHMDYDRAAKTGDRAEARGLTIFVFFAASLLNRLDLLIGLFVLETVINNVYRVTVFFRKGKDRSRDLPGPGLERA